ncbi:hypothetical protein [Allomeiothermus silvanus]|nr:hypothetical protein [Allomeiothermus silvanus]
MMRLRYLPLVLLLSACSAHTLTTIKTDLVPFIPQGSRSGETNTPGTQYVPSQAGQAIQLNLGDALKVLEGARIKIRVKLENTSSVDNTVSVVARIAPVSDSSNIFDGGNNTDCQTNDCLLGQGSLTLPAGSNNAIEIDVPITPTANLSALALLKSGQFRIGLSLQVSGSLRYTLEQGQLTVQARLFQLLNR